MGDPSSARKYCAQLYDSNPQTGKDALHTLLGTHLKQGETLDALQLLGQQGFRMSPEVVLSSLPNDTSVKDIAGFLQAQLRSLTGRLRTDKVDVALLGVHLLRSQEALLEHSQRHTVIDGYRTCKVCSKRLGHSVVSIYPNDVVVHYGCTKKFEHMVQIQKERHLAGSFSRK
jgi:hypothetical protein